jgi:1-acyl-sn-glycerol-3-phosphate acyltransferase
MIYSLFIWVVGLLIIIFYGFMLLRIFAFLTGKRKEASFHGGRAWGTLLLWMTGIKIKIEGLENITGYNSYIFSSNHASGLDILIVLASMPRPFIFVMDDQLFKIPFMGAWCRFAGYREISRTNPRKAQQDIQKIIDRLRQGESAIIFAEGGRSRDGRLHNFKSGVGVLAGESGVPVIPVAISGSFKLMRRRSVIINPGRITVKFGTPMQFGPDESPILIAAAVHDKVQEMLSS